MTCLVVVDATHPDPDALDLAVEVLSRGGIVAYPTDTLYGLAVDPRDKRAVERLFQAKGRGADVAIPLIASDLSQVLAVVSGLTRDGERLAERFWPGPLTLIYPASTAVTDEVHGGAGTIAVRIPDYPIARALARQFGFCITATSANRSGEPPASTASDVVAGFPNEIDLVIEAGATPGGLPSTIVDLSGPAPRLVRAGKVPWVRVLESLQ